MSDLQTTPEPCVECDCTTAISADGTRRTYCSSQQMMRAVAAGEVRPPGVALGAPGDTDAERAAWLADKIVAGGDYAKEAAQMLRRWPTDDADVPALTDEQIEDIAERLEATDPTATFWRVFARAVLAAAKADDDAERCEECERGTQGLSGSPKWCCYCGSKLTGEPWAAVLDDGVSLLDGQTESLSGTDAAPLVSEPAVQPPPEDQAAKAAYEQATSLDKHWAPYLWGELSEATKQAWRKAVQVDAPLPPMGQRLYRTEAEVNDELLQLLLPDLQPDDLRTDGGSVNMPKVRSLLADRRQRAAEQPETQQPNSFHQTSASGVCDVQTALPKGTT